jgi:hypothetical protein
MAILLDHVTSINDAAEAMRGALAHLPAAPGQKSPADAFKAYNGMVVRGISDLLKELKDVQARLQLK